MINKPWIILYLLKKQHIIKQLLLPSLELHACRPKYNKTARITDYDAGEQNGLR
jgi:hypothetical protein